MASIFNKFFLIVLFGFWGAFIHGKTVYLKKLSIEDAESIALENNNQVNTLRELYKKAVQGKLESYSKWMPQITAMSEMFVANKNQVFTNEKSAFLTQLSLTQSILAMDKYYNVEIAKLVQKQLKLLLDAAIIDTLYEVRSLYYLSLLNLEKIAAAREKIELLSSLANRMEDRYDIGLTILYNVNQSKVAIANANAEYYEVIKNYKVDLDRLIASLGYDPGDVEISFPKEIIPVETIPLIERKLDQLGKIFENKVNLPSDRLYAPGFPETELRASEKLFTKSEMHYWEKVALSFEPGLKVYQNYVDIARKEVSKELGAYAPNLSLDINYGGNPTEQLFVPATSISSQTFQWGVGLKFNWLLFDSLGRERRVSMARHNQRAKEFEFKNGLQKTLVNLRKQIFSLEESASTYLTADANVKLAEQTVNLANDQLDIGYVTVFDYQITVNSLIQAINIKNQARYSLIKAYFGLRHASGIDLESYDGS